MISCLKWITFCFALTITWAKPHFQQYEVLDVSDVLAPYVPKSVPHGTQNLQSDTILPPRRKLVIDSQVILQKMDEGNQGVISRNHHKLPVHYHTYDREKHTIRKTLSHDINWADKNSFPKQRKTRTQTVSYDEPEHNNQQNEGVQTRQEERLLNAIDVPNLKDFHSEANHKFFQEYESELNTEPKTDSEALQEWLKVKFDDDSQAIKRWMESHHAHEYETQNIQNTAEESKDYSNIEQVEPKNLGVIEEELPSSLRRRLSADDSDQTSRTTKISPVIPFALLLSVLLLGYFSLKMAKLKFRNPSEKTPQSDTFLDSFDVLHNQAVEIVII